MDIIIFFSKYIFLFLIALLAFSSVVTILEEKDKLHLNLNNPSMLLVGCFHALASFILIFNKNFSIDKQALIFCAVVTVFLIFFKTIVYFLYYGSDYLLINIMLFFLDISFLFLYRLDKYYAYRQLAFSFLASVVIIIIPVLFNFFNTGVKKFKHFDYIFIVLIFSFLVLPFKYGVETYGATNWVYLNIFGGFTFQPSEICKVLYIFYLASVFSKSKSILDLIVPTLVSFFTIVILAMQVDFGGCLMFFTIYLILLYVTTSSKTLLILGVSSLSGAFFIAYKFVYHIRVRVDIFIDPFKDPYGKGLQILQSLFAIGTKAPFGTGFTKGYPKYVPVVDSDFIFAGISEEFGAIFGIILILIFLIFLLRGIKIAKEANDKHLILLALGFSICLGFQTFLIISGNIKLIPLTGVTLPFISYGGTSIFMSIITVAILLRIDITNLRSIGSFKPLIYTRKNVNRVLIFFYMIYFAMIISLSKFTFIDSEKMVSSVYNPRITIENNDYIRGRILDKDGVVLASSAKNDDGTQTRLYPFDKAFAHTVGANSKGKTGLELYANFILQKPSFELLQATGNLLFDNDIYGNNIKTTLDSDLQQYCYEQLGNQKGSIIVQNTQTGQILSMVSYNNFNPKTYDQDFDSLKSDEKNTPLINRGTQGLYPPGSVFKIISALDIIHNLEDYENYTYNCKGYAEIDGEIIRCNNDKAHGEVDLKKAFTVSCNSYFATAISEIEPNLLKKEAENFMFNSAIDFRLPVSVSEFSLTDMSKTYEVMQTAIGQGNTLSTPLLLSMMGQTIANSGVTMTPYIIDSVISYDGKEVKKFLPKVLNKNISATDASIISDMMENVVLEGTAKSAKLNNSITSAGKTGTAEVLGDSSHGLYVSYAPVDNPEIVVCVVLENCGGSQKTLPIAKNIMDYYFSHK